MKKLICLFATLALTLAVAAEKSYKITLAEPASLNGTQLQPGDYRVQMEGDKAMLKMGKTMVEAPAKVESAEHKYPVTSVDFENTNGKLRISEIHVGGTNTRIVFSGSAAAGQ